MSQQSCAQANCNLPRHIGKAYCLEHYKTLGEYEYGLDAEIQRKLRLKYDPAKEQQAQAWIEAVIGEKFPGNFQESLKNGVRLCKLINAIKPGSVKRINTMKTPFKEMENIAAYLAACSALNVRTVDQFVTNDLYEAANMGQVVDQIHALGGMAMKVSGFNGPYLGVKHSDKNKRNFTAAQLNTAATPSRQTVGSYGYQDESKNPNLDRQIIKNVSGVKGSDAVPRLAQTPAAHDKGTRIDKIIRNADEFEKNKGGPQSGDSGSKFCGSCGAARSGSAKFCGNCGGKF